MPRVNIYFSKKDLELLRAFINQNYPNQQAQSLVVTAAIREYIKNKTTKFEVHNGGT